MQSVCTNRERSFAAKLASNETVFDDRMADEIFGKKDRTGSS